MHKLEVKNFGPLESCEAQLNKLTLLIGPQSSGKSTISKLFYFFLHIRDEYIRFLLEAADEAKSRTLGRDLEKLIRKRFLEFWGPTPQGNDLYIKYYYSHDVWIEIALDSSKHKFIDPKFSPKLLSELKTQFDFLVSKKKITSDSSNLFSNAATIANEISDSEKIEKLILESKRLFNFAEDLLFIPAGRSLLSTLSDQLQYINPHQLDYTTRSFIERINKTKSFFSKSIEDIIREKQLLGGEEVWFSATRKVEGIIKKILKGEYIHDKDGGKLYVNKKTYTKINFASSGQQESIWILLSLFLVVLEKVKAQIFIEEPEAHLFPIAQKEMVELISFLQKQMNTKFVITTHSPYILSALNNHIYANELGKSKENEVATIIPKNSWIKYENVSGYFVSSGNLDSLCDESIKMLKTELVDSASDIVNNEYDRLFMLEEGEGVQA